MKGLGLGAAGIGAAAAAAPVFRDMDEAIGSSKATHRYPWYVSELEYDKPTAEIDWGQITRYDWTKPYVEPTSTSTPGKWDDRGGPLGPLPFQNQGCYRLNGFYRPQLEDWIKVQFPEWKGDTIRDSAIYEACQTLAFYNYPAKEGKGKFLGIQKARTPEYIGVPRWQGTPEENMRMVRCAARLFGGFHVGSVEVNTNNRNLSYLTNSGGKLIEWADVDEAEETDTKYLVPKKCNRMIVYTHPQTSELTIRAASVLGQSAVRLAYARMPFIMVQMQEFIRGLGYQSLDMGSLTPSNAWGTLAGLGEHARQAYNLVSPDLGSYIRGVERILTDMPLSPTKPIDSGIYEFCKTCKICADMCPFGALSMDDPTWEGLRPGWSGGFKGWRLDVPNCPRDAVCLALCPFNSTDVSFTHDVVKATIATTSLFNGFFANMEKTFQYGIKDSESWWSLDNEPVYGHASTHIRR